MKVSTLMLAEWLDQTLNPVLAKLTGFRLVRHYPKLEDVRDKFIKELRINYAIDGGANFGQWAKAFRKRNPQIEIHSFEPVRIAFESLNSKPGKDDRWFAYNFALGREDQESVIFLSTNSFMSSSLLNPENHLSTFPSVEFDGVEKIKVKRLDSFKFGSDRDLLFLKLDVQGSELSALEGAESLLSRVALIEIETALRPMYEGELSHSRLVLWLEDNGFQIYSIASPSVDNNGQAGYLDCLFINKRILGENELIEKVK